MRASKIPWVSHKECPILSVDVQPNGYRFVTGGADGLVGVWNLLPVISEKYEEMGMEAETETEQNRVSGNVEESKDEEMRESSVDSEEELTPEEKVRKETRTRDFAKDETLMEGLFSSDEARAKRCLAMLDNHSGPVNCVRWNNLGTMFASADDEGTIILWEYRGHTVITAF
jgi:protein HIRA/HIR1